MCWIMLDDVYRSIVGRSVLNNETAWRLEQGIDGVAALVRRHGVERQQGNADEHIADEHIWAWEQLNESTKNIAEMNSKNTIGKKTTILNTHFLEGIHEMTKRVDG